MKIEKIGLEPLITEELRKKSSAALDHLWEEAWVKAAVSKTDRARETMIQEIAKEFEEKSDVVIVAADGLLAEQIRAVVSALPQDEGRAQVQVFGGTFSPVFLWRTADRFTGKRLFSDRRCRRRGNRAFAGRLCLSQTASSVQVRRRRCGRKADGRCRKPEQAAFHGKPRTMISPLLRFPAGVSAGCAANTEAVLLPLAISGADTGQYLEGFYDMLASPFWDLDGADYGLARAACRIQSGLQEELWIWQAQLRPFGIWREYAAKQMRSEC